MASPPMLFSTSGTSNYIYIYIYFFFFFADKKIILWRDVYTRPHLWKLILAFQLVLGFHRL